MSRICVCGHVKDYHDAHLIADPSVSGLCSIWLCGCREYRASSRSEAWVDAAPFVDSRMPDVTTPRLMVGRGPCLDSGARIRSADERDIDLVIAWLREQGAIDTEAAAKALYGSRPEVASGAWPDWEDLRSAGRSLYLTNARAVIDAALRLEGDE